MSLPAGSRLRRGYGAAGGAGEGAGRGVCGARYPPIVLAVSVMKYGRNDASAGGRPEWNTGTYVVRIHVMTPATIPAAAPAATFVSIGPVTD